MDQKIILGILVIADLLVSTFLVSAYVINNRTATDSDDLSERQESLKLLPLAKLSEGDVKSIALKEISSEGIDAGEITEILLERENGDVVYAVEFTKDGVETDVEVDAITGAVLKIDSDLYDETNKEDKREGKNVAIIGSALNKASAAALDYIGEGRVTDTEVGDEEGYYEIEITLDNGNEVDVHLDKDFKVLSKETDNDNEEDED
ncbi:MAG: PepSY domain-containing protein [Nanoarchaeota archaeon]|mgnify:CR=1 FL=1